ncbi:hypothetical protein [Streptomyces noursei]
MPYVMPTPNRAVRGAVKAQDKAAIYAALEAGGVDVSAVACNVSELGTGWFLSTVTHRGGNDLRGELSDQVSQVLEAAGWVLVGARGAWRPGPVTVVGRPTPRQLWGVEDVADYLCVTEDRALAQLLLWGVQGHGARGDRYDAELVRALGADDVRVDA